MDTQISRDRTNRRDFCELRAGGDGNMSDQVVGAQRGEMLRGLTWGGFRRRGRSLVQGKLPGLSGEDSSLDSKQ